MIEFVGVPSVSHRLEYRKKLARSMDSASTGLCILNGMAVASIYCAVRYWTAGICTIALVAVMTLWHYRSRLSYQ